MSARDVTLGEHLYNLGTSLENNLLRFNAVDDTIITYYCRETATVHGIQTGNLLIHQITATFKTMEKPTVVGC